MNPQTAHAFNTSRANQFAGWVMDFISPRFCDLCQSSLHHREALFRWGARRDLCTPCEDRLSPLERPFCMRCGEAFDGDTGDRDFRCVNCDGRKLWFEFAIAAYRAEDDVRDLIHRYKFLRKLRLRQTLANMLVDVFRHDPRLSALVGEADTVLVPVPLHRRRHSARGFNQSLHLARLAGRELGVNVRHSLSRLRATEPQSQLNRQERLDNLKGAFGLKKRPWLNDPVRDKTVVLIDDVFTTGTTAAECAKVLIRDGGAARVLVATIARG